MNNNKTHLEAVIAKATQNGWEPSLEFSDLIVGEVVLFVKVRNLLLAKDFAKAFFGDRQETTDTPENPWAATSKCLHCGYNPSFQPPRATECNHVHYPDDCDVCRKKAVGWQDHLQKVVLEESPLDYYFSNL